MRQIVLASLACVLMCADGAQGQDDYQSELIVDGLEYPWSLAELPDGALLVTEKPGRLRLIEDGVLRAAAISGVPDVMHDGQGGLMDVVLHPDFASNQLVYLSWSAGAPRNNALKLGRGRLVGRDLVDFAEIFVATPRRQTNVHLGGRLVFLPDGSLLLGIGDGFDFREEAQRPTSHYGSFVHLNDDGTPIAGPFPGSAPGVFTIGHRNPQAVVIDPVTDEIYAHEHGPRGGDEINRLVEGENYGWPITTHGLDYTGALVTPFSEYPGMTDPLHVWVPSIAPAGMALYRGEMFPEWQGDLLVAALIAGDADLPTGHLRRVDLEAGVVVGESILLGEAEARLRDVRVASDGSVYVLTDAERGRLIRLFR
jgi:glucose/arabinose dehydrogenase